MEVAKLFTNGGSQAVRLPKDFRFEGEDEVYIKKYGRVVYLFPKKEKWEIFLEGLEMFTDDFMEDGRDQLPLQDRALL
ncbi:MAG: type II toxin-antitoxin system VapB family antitoxin [Coriobacteriales bacterium]|nr:type II toxin-antitoxin system VapB family antitoxin [Coriobacteriales bacterium]